jgi:hypothetical protein
MSRMRWAVVAVAAVIGLFLFFGGAAILVNGTPYEATYTSYTGSWGVVPAFIGLLVLGVTAFVVWDAS